MRVLLCLLGFHRDEVRGKYTSDLGDAVVAMCRACGRPTVVRWL